MDVEKQISDSETHVFKVVFPDTTNHHNTMFGGRVILMMTETAFMTATRFSRNTFVIVSCKQIDFGKPIPVASLVELIGRVEKIGNTSIDVKVDVYLEAMNENKREHVVTGVFTLVALDDDKNPVKIVS